MVEAEVVDSLMTTKIMIIRGTIYSNPYKNIRCVIVRAEKGDDFN